MKLYITKSNINIPRGFSKACAAAMLLLLASSCNHKGFEDPETDKVRVKVAYDWSDAPDANPEGMSVFFYNSVDGTSKRFDFTGTEGGYVDLEANGIWHITTYNNDTPGVQGAYSHGYDTHMLTTREGSVLEPVLGNGISSSLRPAPGAQERSVIAPDMIWGHSMDNVDLSALPGVTEKVITLTPHELVCHYSYEIRNVKNLQHVEKMCASLSGMSGALYTADESLHTECVTIPFEANASGSNTITGEFLTFGHHEDNEAPHTMQLYVWLDNGKKWVFGTDNKAFDVTEQIHAAPDKRHVHYIIDGLEIPYEITDTPGGFDASADNWGELNYELEI